MADNIVEQQVYQEVLAEIKKVGATSSENIDEMNRNYKKLKDTLDKGIEGNREFVSKLQEDILTRQEAIDKKTAEAHKRMDELEVSMKRPGKILTADDKEFTEAKNWMISCIAAKELASYDKVNKLEVNMDDFKGYKKSFESYLRKDEKQVLPEDYKALSVGIDPDGGYTVTPTMSNMILTRLYESDPIRQLASIESISTDAFEELIDWSEANCGWEGETQTGSETSTPSFNKKRIPVHIMYAKPRATQQLLEDSGINIESWLSNKVADKMSRTEGAAFVSGDGIGKPRGFLTYANGTTYGTIERVNMGAAATLTADGFINIKYALKEFYLSRGTWLLNRTTVREAMKLKDGAGDYLWKPGLSTDTNATILSLPVRMSTTMPTVAANALSVALADWTEAYKIVDRLGITVQRDPYTAKPFVEFYTRKRVGGDVINWDAIKIGVIAV